MCLFWLKVAELGCMPWLDYVPSASNMGDIPSRWSDGRRDTDGEPLWTLGRYVAMVFPPLANLQGQWASLAELLYLWPRQI